MRRRLLDVRPGELQVTLVAFAYFFLLLGGWYLLRPIRDALGVTVVGVKNLPWLFTATFVAMLVAVPLWSAVVARWPRPRVVPVVYRFFLVNLLVFWAVFRFGGWTRWATIAFFVWTSVFNLFVVSVFWSLMADLFSSEQGKRLFGFISAGGSAGALAGPAFATAGARVLGPTTLMLCSALVLEMTVVCVRFLVRWRPPRADAARAPEPERRVGGGVLTGFVHMVRSRYLLGISLGTLLFTVTSTILYSEQATLVAHTMPDAAARVALFAKIDLGVNLVSLLFQALFTGWVITRFGVAAAVVMVPALTCAGFVLLGGLPTMLLLVAVQGLRRAAHFAVDRPAREVLFTVTSPEDKYKTKNVIDTIVYRGGDLVSVWIWGAMSTLGLGLGGTSLLSLPLAAAWVLVMVRVGRGYEQRTREASAEAWIR